MIEQGTKKRTHYTEEFKRDAVELLGRRGSKLGEVARGLGITATTLAAWRDRMKGREDAPPGWTMEDMHAEVLRLREELSSVTAQRDVLKKACGILCEPPSRGTPR
jgi:transposase